MATSRAFYPRMYTASPSRAVLNTPWFLDYGHLVFWFFFFSTFVIILWLVYFASSIIHNIETRKPIRETRGFSRAQTGDVLTAVLPMTWSITMLMHASTHSANFDENTAATSFSFHVIAYQWGWNYYFPRDIVTQLSGAPRLVGRNRVEASKLDFSYEQVSAAFRRDYVARLTLQGQYASRTGKAAAPMLLAVFAQPLGVSSRELGLVFGRSAAGTQAGLGVDALHLAEAHALVLQRRVDVQLRQQLALGHAAAKARVVCVSGYLAPLPAASELSARAWALTPARARNTALRSGNRLSLIHRHLTSAAQLPTEQTLPQRQAAFLRQLGDVSGSLASFALSLPAALNQAGALQAPIAAANLGLNLGLARSNAATACAWGAAQAQAAVGGAKLDLLAGPLAANLQPRAASAQGRTRQLLSWDGAELSLGAQAAGLYLADDQGPNSPATTSVMQLRESLNAATSLAHVQAAASTRAYPQAARADSTGLPGFDVAAGLEAAYLAVSRPSARARAGALLPLATSALTLSAEKSTLINQTLAGDPQAAAYVRAPSLTPTIAAAQGLLAQTQQAPATKAAAALLSAAGAQNNLLTARLVSFSDLGEASVTRARLLSWLLLSDAASPLSGALASPACSACVGLEPRLSLSALAELAVWSRYSGLSRPARAARTLRTLPALPVRAGTPSVGPFYAHGLLPALKLAAGSLVGLGASPSRPSLPAPMQRASLPAFASLGLPAPLGAYACYSALGLAGRPAFTPWASAVSTVKPIWLSSMPTLDLALLGAKPAFSAHAAPQLSDAGLGARRQLWALGLTSFSLPADKLLRGGIARRPASGFWNAHPADASLQGWTAAPAWELSLAKNGKTAALPELYRALSRPWFFELAPALLDVEWAPLVQVLPLITPAAYADVDPTFTHRHWAFEVNTTRRSDHDTRYSVTWGPALARLLAKQGTNAPAQAAWAGSTGPAARGGLAARTLRELALLANNELSFKFAQPHRLGCQPALAQGGLRRTGVAGTRLAGPLSPAYGLGRRAVDQARMLARSSSLGLQQLSICQRASGAGSLFGSAAWSELWEFRAASARQLGVNAYPGFASLWAAKAAALSTLRQDAASLLSRQTGVSGANPQPQALLACVTRLSVPARGESLALAQKSALTLGYGRASRPARAGFSVSHDNVGLQRRLRVTKGICLPADVPMHVICGSKDVIHSWAIPGLGVKIDCIPGYNSHRRLLLRWRGVYWGQCMEVCGRYHHWMPLLVRVVHKDLFLSWCLTYLRALEARSLSQQQAVTLAQSTSLKSLEAWLAA